MLNYKQYTTKRKHSPYIGKFHQAMCTYLLCEEVKNCKGLF